MTTNPLSEHNVVPMEDEHPFRDQFALNWQTVPTVNESDKFQILTKRALIDGKGWLVHTTTITDTCVVGVALAFVPDESEKWGQ